MPLILIAIFLLFLYVKAVLITEQVYYQRYSNANQGNFSELMMDDMLPNDIDPQLPWNFFVHGWMIIPAGIPYFSKGRYNIIWVDWSKLGGQNDGDPVANAVGAGEYIGMFILYLMGNGGCLGHVHLQGYTLGSHMIAFSGKFVNEETAEEKQIGLITGLNSATLLNEENLKLLRTLEVPAILILDKDDAEFVDAMHPDFGDIGMRTNIGHVEFHLNAEENYQPECELIVIGKLFIESISNDNFVAEECANYELYLNGSCENDTIGNLGENIQATELGVFFS